MRTMLAILTLTILAHSKSVAQFPVLGKPVGLALAMLMDSTTLIDTLYQKETYRIMVFRLYRAKLGGLTGYAEVGVDDHGNLDGCRWMSGMEKDSIFDTWLLALPRLTGKYTTKDHARLVHLAEAEYGKGEEMTIHPEVPFRLYVMNLPRRYLGIRLEDGTLEMLEVIPKSKK
ncbi:MAG: hypothetical protein ABI876_02190 [Bacteroidota bacterium]